MTVLAIAFLAFGAVAVDAAAGSAAQTVDSASSSLVIITSDLLGVTATSAASAWAVGYRWNGSVRTTIIGHWNGKAWVRAAAPNLGYQGGTLDAVAATSAGKRNRPAP